MAYELFDGKYSMSEIGQMPYCDLMDAIDREQEFQKRINEQRSRKN